MEKDRYTRVVLGIIAAGLWALTLAQLELPTARAEAATHPVTPSSAVGPRLPGAVQQRPLRWRIGYAAHYNPDQTTTNECRMSVSLLSAGPVANTVDVEFFDDDSASLGTGTVTVGAGESSIVRTNGGAGTTLPFPLGDVAVATGTFLGGFALVYADDPRIQVAAFLHCREDFGIAGSSSQDLRAMTHIPAYPVGASLAYFQAGVPGPAGSPGTAPAPAAASAPR